MTEKNKKESPKADAWAHLAPTLTSYITWIKLLQVSEPQSLHLWKWDTTTYIMVIPSDDVWKIINTMSSTKKESPLVNVREMNLPIQFRVSLTLLLDLEVMKEPAGKPYH